MADSLYHTGKSRERLAVFVCLHFGLSYQQLLEFSFVGLVGCVTLCVLGGKVEKEEVIPKTMVPGPTQDCGSWPTASLPSAWSWEFIKEFGSLAWDSSDIVWMETKARNVVSALEGTKGLNAHYIIGNTFSVCQPPA